MYISYEGTDYIYFDSITLFYFHHENICTNLLNYKVVYFKIFIYKDQYWGSGSLTFATQPLIKVETK